MYSWGYFVKITSQKQNHWVTVSNYYIILLLLGYISKSL